MDYKEKLEALKTKLSKTFDNEMGMVDILTIALFIVIIGIVSMIGIYIMQSVSIKTALATTDTFYAASQNATNSVTTGFAFQTIMILAAIATVIIGMLLGIVPGMGRRR